MNKIFMLIIFIILCISCAGCNQSGEYILPTFKPLDNTADIVIVENNRPPTQSELIAINTKTSKVSRIYRFDKATFQNPIGVTKNGSVFFTMYGRVCSLNLLTGKCEVIYSDPVWSINNLYGKYVYFTDDYEHTDSYYYDTETQKSIRFATLGAITSNIVNVNNNLYSVCYVGRIEQFENFVNIITNLTTKSPIIPEILTEQNYEPFEIHGNKYLVSEDMNNGGFAIHEIISFEPVNLKFITHIYGFIDDMTEDNDYIYIGDHRGYVKVIRKSDSQIIAEAKDLPEFEGGGFTVIRDGYAWLGAGMGSGDFIRVDLTDDDGDGVLKWQLIKSLD